MSQSYFEKMQASKKEMRYGRVGRGGKIHALKFYIDAETGETFRVRPICGSGDFHSKTSSAFKANPSLTSESVTCEKCRVKLAEIAEQEAASEPAPAVTVEATEQEAEPKSIRTLAQATIAYLAAERAHNIALDGFNDQYGNLQPFEYRMKRREIMTPLIVDLAAAERDLLDCICVDLDAIAVRNGWPVNSAKARQDWANGINLEGKDKTIAYYLGRK